MAVNPPLMRAEPQEKGKSMTRKDYERIAAAVREAYEFEEEPAGWRAVSRVAHILAYSLSNENPRFDKERFLDACGFPSLVK